MFCNELFRNNYETVLWSLNVLLHILEICYHSKGDDSDIFKRYNDILFISGCRTGKYYEWRDEESINKGKFCFVLSFCFTDSHVENTYLSILEVDLKSQPGDHTLKYSLHLKLTMNY